MESLLLISLEALVGRSDQVDPIKNGSKRLNSLADNRFYRFQLATILSMRWYPSLPLLIAKRILSRIKAMRRRLAGASSTGLLVLPATSMPLTSELASQLLSVGCVLRSHHLNVCV